MLTVRMLKPTIRDIEWLRKTNAPVGCDPDSFVGNYLTDVLKLKNIKSISLQSEYPENFKNGNISAAFLELPYKKYFLKEYCNEHTAVGPSYKFGGLCFELYYYLMEEGKIRELENQWLNTSQTCSNSNPGLDLERLSLAKFWGIFLISASGAILLSHGRRQDSLEYLEEAIQPKVVHRYIKVVFQAFAAGMRMAKACALAYLAALSKSSGLSSTEFGEGIDGHDVLKRDNEASLHGCFSRHQSSLDMGDNISGKGMTQEKIGVHGRRLTLKLKAASSEVKLLYRHWVKRRWLTCLGDPSIHHLVKTTQDGGDETGVNFV
ncbi:hypothetical protein Tco_0164202 [Tanacetum coccineum]